MPDISRKLYYYFLNLSVIAYIALMYTSFTSLFFKNEPFPLVYVAIIITISCITTSFICSLKKISWPFKLLFSFIIPFAIVFGLKYGLIILLGNNMQGSDMALIVIITVMCFIMFYLVQTLGGKYDFAFTIANSFSQFETSDKYMAWVAGKIDTNRGGLKTDWYLDQIFSLAALALFFGFLGAIKNPASSGWISVYLILFVLGALGNYMLLYQVCSVMEWHSLGYKIPSNLISNWNKLIGFFFLPVTIIALIIPRNFTIFSSDTLKGFLNKLFDSLNMSSSQIEQSTNGSYNGNADLTPIAPGASFSIAIFQLLIIPGILLGIYIIMGLIGLILRAIYKNKPRPDFVQFFIDRGEGLIKSLESLLTILLFILKFPLLILTSFFPKKKVAKNQAASNLEKQLFSFFKEYEDLNAEKKQEIKTIIHEFIRFIKTASAQLIPYYNFYGPAEYGKKAAEIFPEIQKEVTIIVSTFNESRYSLHILTPQQIQNYKGAIEMAIRKIEYRETK